MIKTFPQWCDKYGTASAFAMVSSGMLVRLGQSEYYVAVNDGKAA